jgi:sigma-B regulation protein RsbU (phosphoserine phosphatase)
MKILVVDDDNYIRALLKGILTKMNHNVILASSVEEALELFNQDIDLVILDWMMEGLSGPDFCKIIRDEDLEKYIYIILLTSKNEKEEVIKGLSSGADDFISKPFNIDELKVRINVGQRIIEKEKELSSAYNKIKNDLESASKIQKVFLPNKNSSISIFHKSILPELDKNIKVISKNIERINFDWIFLPSQYLSGDFFNFVRLDENNFGIYLGDVSGHGIPSSLLSLTMNKLLIPYQSNFLKTFYREEPYYKINEPSEVFENLNNYLLQDNESNKYITLSYLILNVDTSTLKFCISGNPPILVIRENKVLTLENTNIPIGLIENETFLQKEIETLKGDKIIVFSDGIIEHLNYKEEMFGIERLINFFEKNINNNINNTLKDLEKEIINWNSEKIEDDISLLMVELN